MGDERAIVPAWRERSTVDPVDRLIAALAERQHGVVARVQLLEIGLSSSAIGLRVKQGRLHPLHLGVYAVGHRAVPMRGRWMAGVLAAGEGAAASHRAAAALWSIRQSSAVEVTAPGRVRRPGVLTHRAPLPADEVTTVDGIPVTTVPRTMLDLAAVVPAHQLERAVNEAEYRRLGDALSLGDIVARYPRRRAIAAVRRLVDAGRIGASRTRSDMEAAFLSFLDAENLPRPETNAYVFAGGRWHECDCVWRDAKLIVELDGYGAHGTRRAFHRDRADDRSLTVAGWQVVRVTDRHLHQGRDQLAADLRALTDGDSA